MNESKSRSKASAGVVVLCLLAAILVALGITALLYFWGASQTKAASEKEGSAERASNVTVFTSAEIVDASAPAPAPAPGPGGTTTGGEGYHYHDIIAQEDGLLVAHIQGKRWKGLIAVIDDPSRITVGTCGTFGGYGKTVLQMAENAGATLAINGGEFSDPGGNGTGGEPLGVVLQEGEILCGGAGYTVGADFDGKLYAGWYSASYCRDIGMRWALSYGPTLIMDGKIQSVDNALSEPRTAVGQRADGSIIFVCIAGRQPAALGVTNLQMAYIMQDYGCINAGNLDGGASSYMVYGGEYLNIPNTSGVPRGVPTCILVMPKEGGEG